MRVKDLSERLQGLPPNLEVGFAFPSGDTIGTMLVAFARTVREEPVKALDKRFRAFRLLHVEEQKRGEPGDTKLVVLLGVET